MEDIKREIYEMDAIEAKEAEALNNRMIEKGYEKCDRCDHWVSSTTNGLCDSCIDERIADTTVEEVIEYAEKNDDLFILLTQYLYNEEQAVEILKECAIEAAKTIPTLFKNDIKEYIDNDVSHYIEYLDEKGDL